MKTLLQHIEEKLKVNKNFVSAYDLYDSVLHIIKTMGDNVYDYELLNSAQIANSVHVQVMDSGVANDFSNKKNKINKVAEVINKFEKYKHIFKFPHGPNFKNSETKMFDDMYSGAVDELTELYWNVSADFSIDYKTDDKDFILLYVGNPKYMVTYIGINSKDF